jgi:hypothetical protein
MLKEICTICINEDFGYCGLRNSKVELEYKHDKHQNLIKCSGFCPDCSKLKRMFKIEVKDDAS